MRGCSFTATSARVVCLYLWFFYRYALCRNSPRDLYSADYERITENDDRLCQSWLFNDSVVFELPPKCQCQCFYTLIYFDDSSAVQVPSALFSYWLFGLLAISILLLGSSFAKSIYQGLLFIGVCYLMGMLGNLWSQVTNWNPYSLSSQFPNYLTDQIKLGELLPALLLSCLLIISCLAGAIAVLRKETIKTIGANVGLTSCR